MEPTFVAVIILIIGGAVVAVSDEWRVRLMALVVQYTAVAILLSFEIFPALGVIRLVAGSIAAMILFQAFRHAPSDRVQGNGQDLHSPGLFLRISTVLFSAVVSFGLAQTYPLPDFSRDVTVASYWLILSSVSSLVLSQEISRVGFALLMLEMASALLAGVFVETANLARFLLASLSSIVLALAVAFLIGLDRSVSDTDANGVES